LDGRGRWRVEVFRLLNKIFESIVSEEMKICYSNWNSSRSNKAFFFSSLFICKQNKAKHSYCWFFQQTAKAKHSRELFIVDFISWWLLFGSRWSCPLCNLVSEFRSSSSSSSNVRYISASEAVRVDIERSISEHESSQVSTSCPSEFNSLFNVPRRRCNSLLRDVNKAISFSYSRSLRVND
jgi:hypothetical protein